MHGGRLITIYNCSLLYMCCFYSQEARLKGRDTETDESLKRRLDLAIREIDYCKYYISQPTYTTIYTTGFHWSLNPIKADTTVRVPYFQWMKSFE